MHQEAFLNHIKVFATKNIFTPFYVLMKLIFLLFIICMFLIRCDGLPGEKAIIDLDTMGNSTSKCGNTFRQLPSIFHFLKIMSVSLCKLRIKIMW